MEAQVEELKRTLAQVHSDSREIERELELELQARDSECTSLQSQLKQALADTAHWKRQFEDSQAHIRTIEQVNDEYEQRSRINDTTISKLEQENQVLLEKLALAEADAVLSQSIEADLQRTRQSLVEAEEEIMKLQSKSLSKGPVQQPPQLNDNNNLEGRKQRVPKSTPFINQPTELRSCEWTLPEEDSLTSNTVHPLARRNISKGHGYRPPNK